MAGGYTLTPKPWWLRLVISDPYNWVTLGSTIYHPPCLNPFDFPAVIAHELVHVGQQSQNRWSWLWKYLTNGPFRLDQEAQAIAAELTMLPGDRRMGVFRAYVDGLAGSAYHRAAKSRAEAFAAITKYLPEGVVL